MTDEKTPLWEDILIILAILALWPAVFHWETPATRAVMYAAVPAMAWVLWRRIRRFRRLIKHDRTP